jgi:hypothetical protein
MRVLLRNLFVLSRVKRYQNLTKVKKVQRVRNDTCDKISTW